MSGMIPFHLADRPAVWKPITVQRGAVSVAGGYQNKSILAESIDRAEADGTIHSWILLEKRTWLPKILGAKTYSDIQNVSVIDDLRKLCIDQDDEDDDDDPMEQLSSIGKAAKKCTPQPRPQTMSVVVRQRPECAVPDAGTLNVDVYLNPCTRGITKMKRPIYLRSDHLDWFTAYAADQMAFQGVVASTPSDGNLQSRAPNIEDVPGLHVGYAFNRGIWRGSFLEGDHANVVKEIGPDAMTDTTWSVLEQLHVGVDRSNRKEAARLLLIAWCKATLQGEGDAFGSQLALADPLATPPKRRRRSAKAMLSSAVAEDGPVSAAGAQASAE